jgi:hypothetical protein
VARRRASWELDIIMVRNELSIFNAIITYVIWPGGGLKKFPLKESESLGDLLIYVLIFYFGSAATQNVFEKYFEYKKSK